MTRTVASKFTVSDASSPALQFGGFACGRREVFLQAPSRRIVEAVRDVPVLFGFSKKKPESQSVPCSATGSSAMDPRHFAALYGPRSGQITPKLLF
jgi:hypothetical protein